MTLQHILNGTLGLTSDQSRLVHTSSRDHDALETLSPPWRRLERQRLRARRCRAPRACPAPSSDACPSEPTRVVRHCWNSRSLANATRNVSPMT